MEPDGTQDAANMDAADASGMQQPYSETNGVGQEETAGDKELGENDTDALGQ